MSLLNDASLVFIPSGYKEDKVYSIIPSNGAGDLDFVRGCDATRINPQSLVENTPWNLLQQSETFDNTYWLKVNGSITSNATVAPNGTNTADLFTITNPEANYEKTIVATGTLFSFLPNFSPGLFLSTMTRALIC